MNRTVVQGCLVLVRETGVLLRGPAGSGKSMTALRLLDRGHKLVSDDLVRISLTPDGDILGRPLEGVVRIEIRGLGVFKAEHIYPGCTVEQCRIELVTDIVQYVPSVDAGRTTPEFSTTRILDIDIPTARLPIPHGADSALLVEALVAHVLEEA